MNAKEESLPFAVHYHLYLERVRSLMQRYVLVLETQGKEDQGLLSQEPSGDDVAMRCLFGIPMSDERLSAVQGLNVILQSPYEDIAHQIPDNRFEQVRWEFGLSEQACDALWLMLAGKLVPEFMWLFRTLWGDTERSLFDRTFLFHVLDPFGVNQAELFLAFEQTSPLFAQRLMVELRRGNHEEADGLLAPSRRVIRHLLGLDTRLPNVGGLVALHPVIEMEEKHKLKLTKDMLKRLRVGFTGNRRFVLIGADNAGPFRLAHQLMSDQGAPLIEADAEGLIKEGESAVVLLLGEAKLRRAGVYVDKIERLDREDVPATFVRRFIELMSVVRVPLFFRATYGLTARFRLRFTERLKAVELRLHLPDLVARQDRWKRVLADHFEGDDLEKLAFIARAYPFGPDEIDSVISLAKLQARERNPRKVVLKHADIEVACNALSGQNMGELAQRVRVKADWDSVILCESTKAVIDDLVTYGRHQKKVFEDFGYSKKLSYGKGMTALFWGPPGTGKTLVSGLLARELGLELYRIELSQVVSKYIGETEQRLAQIFDEAVASGMALLFDEADALFAKRTEVKSSVDRYANLEVNFLLQRIEHHEGVIVLTTNFPKSIDEAFMRRIRFKAEFPAPGVAERTKLWAAMIPDDAPKESEINFEALAEVYEFTGGEIRNAVLRAAFYAAADDEPLSIFHLDRAAQVEYREAGRLVLSSAVSERIRLSRNK